MATWGFRKTAAIRLLRAIADDDWATLGDAKAALSPLREATPLAVMDSGSASLDIPSRNATVTIYSDSIKANEQTVDATDVAAAP